MSKLVSFVERGWLSAMRFLLETFLVPTELAPSTLKKDPAEIAFPGHHLFYLDLMV